MFKPNLFLHSLIGISIQMSHLDLKICKRRKKGEAVFRFNAFGENGYPVEFEGSFRQNVKKLLEFGHFEGCMKDDDSMPSWSFQLEVNRHPPFHIFLVVVEEPIEASPEKHCRHCKYVGWGHHMICNKKYHFVLPSNDAMTNFWSYGDSTFDRRISSEGKLNIVEIEGGHIMHGVFHSNGFGHLLCINGMETGSDLAGTHIMEFWDRLCVGLRSRRVSLIDTSQKKGMELRLLHGVAYGEPWFSRWGYKFGRGSFGVTQLTYQKALETLQGMPLCLLLHFLGNITNDVPLIFSRYQTLSGHILATLGDLFRFMLELKPRIPEENQISSYDIGVIWEPNCRWSPKRIEMATRVIVEALKMSKTRWVPRQEVRDAARVYIGDTGLLDFVLKSLGNHIVGNYLVRRSLNPVTKVLEYCLEDVSNVFPEQGLVVGSSKVRARCKMTRSQLVKDIWFLYNYMFNDQKPMLNMGIVSAMPAATRIILDTKYLVKEYYGEMPSLELEGKLKLYCSVVIRVNLEDTRNRDKNEMSPFECVTLKSNSTFCDLKQEVERNFRELYWGLRGFTIHSIWNLNVRDSDLVFGAVEVGRKLVFEGCNKGNEGLITNNWLIYECGPDDKAVDCPCGAQEDDGERLVTCDICEVWQHTRCVGIPNNQEIPHIFLCNRCEHEVSILPCLP